MGLFKKRAPTRTIELRVTGMSCGHCEMRVGKALTSVPGVRDAHADHTKEMAVVTVEQDVAVKDLVDAVNRTGYIAKAPH